MRVLVNEGLVNVRNFQKSQNNGKYLLTPKGVEEKARVANRFLAKK